MTDSQTEEIIIDSEQLFYVVSIIVFFILMAIIVDARRRKTKSSSNNIRWNHGKRRPFSEATKRDVMERQNGRCKICGEIPKHWEFDHIRGRSDNSIGNCQAYVGIVIKIKL